MFMYWLILLVSALIADIICAFEWCDVTGFVFEYCTVTGFLTAVVEECSGVTALVEECSGDLDCAWRAHGVRRTDGLAGAVSNLITTTVGLLHANFFPAKPEQEPSLSSDEEPGNTKADANKYQVATKTADNDAEEDEENNTVPFHKETGNTTADEKRNQDH